MAADVSDYREEFERCKNALADNHRAAIEDIDFCDLEKQWPEAIARQRMIDQRPMLTINKLPAFKRQVVNDARQNKPSIKVLPVDDQADPETAEVISGLIRNIEAVSNADVAYDTAAEQAVGGGFGYWRIDVDYAYDDSYDLDILIRRVINQFSVYPDPNSTEADSSDWDLAFVTDRIPKTEFKRKYKDKAETNFDSDAWSRVDADWLNDDGVLIAERWTREEIEKDAVFLSDGRIFSLEDFQANPDLQLGVQAGTIDVRGMRPVRSKKVKQELMSGTDILETKDFPSRYIPIVPVYGTEILVQGKRMWRSLIHSAIDAQRAFNFWRSAATELVALAPRVPWVGPKGFAASDEGWDTANVASHPYLEYDPQYGKPERQALDLGPAAGVLQEAISASDDMKSIMGLYDASLGARSNETSGRAIIARQREGDVSTFHFQDNLNRAIRHTGKILVDMIPRVYSEERVLRILGEDGQPETRKVNAPYEVRGEDGEPQMEPTGDVDPEGNEVMQAITAMHDLAAGKYDVVVKSGPSFTTRREEAAYYMTEAVRAAPNTAPILIPKIAEMSDWPGAQEIAEKLEKFMNPNAEGLPPEVQTMIDQGQQMIEQLQQENEQLKAQLGDKSAQTAINARKVENDAKNNAAKNDIAMFNAETDRMNTEIDVAGAQQRKAFGLPIN